MKIYKSLDFIQNFRKISIFVKKKKIVKIPDFCKKLSENLDFGQNFR